jgi:hypothetical protein
MARRKPSRLSAPMVPRGRKPRPTSLTSSRRKFNPDEPRIEEPNMPWGPGEGPDKPKIEEPHMPWGPGEGPIGMGGNMPNTNRLIGLGGNMPDSKSNMAFPTPVPSFPDSDMLGVDLIETSKYDLTPGAGYSKVNNAKSVNKIYRTY